MIMKKVYIFLLGMLYCTVAISQENESSRTFKLNITSNKGKSISFANFSLSGVNEAIPEKGGVMVFENISFNDTLELYLGSKIYPIFIEGIDSMAIAINRNDANTFNLATGKKEKLSNPVSSSNFATSVLSVDDELRKYNNLADYIRGRVAGVLVNGESITIRGTNSLGGGSSGVLFVIDGVSVGSYDMANAAIDVADIDFIEVIKDGEGYGTRGGGGVIKITRKKVGSQPK